ncbi:hypothetical protein LTR37_012935 [Vermiconidia calcicola]|uniref:Uncharacterized protein n=1 Tax=Vermiconidia calcicola TaxID=1690605 RepID=A0ACC3MYF6_9PEZI|nr:hypothetical protein LTR37_012935 [Vermiconidia calcicola]
MSWIVEALLNVHNWWHGVAKIKAATQTSNNPLRFGVLGAAEINYVALFDPISTNPGVTVNAIAARSLSKAQAQIDKYQLEDVRAYGSYDGLLDDPDIDAVYIPLPNGLHCEWAIKAMEAGKHVLIEKPIASNAEQARRIREVSEATVKVALEAFHWRFHPAAHQVKDIVDSGKYGNVTSLYAQFYVSSGFLKDNDIRFQYGLAGGACMDLTYVFSGTTYFACDDIKTSKFKVLAAAPRLAAMDKKVDAAMEATFEVEQAGKPISTCKVSADIARPKLFGLIPKLWEGTPFLSIELEKARIDFPAFVGSWLNHTITITEKNNDGSLGSIKHTEQCYTGGPQWGEGKGERWWTSYRYQLEAFVEMVEARDTGKEYAGPDVGLNESVRIMELIDAVYQKADLPIRDT